MAFNVKTWVDRISEYPNRRRLTKEDNSQEVVNVERYEGDITETGDKFNADTMNDLEERINNAIRGIDSSAIKSITRSGTTFTATRLDDTTFTFSQYDYPTATTTQAGLMSGADKAKLDGIAAGANKYTLPTASSSTLGGVKVGAGLGISSGTLSLAKNSNGSSGGNTFIDMKNGVVIQWGNTAPSHNGYKDVTFPKEFASTNYVVCATCTNPSFQATSTITIQNRTAKGFRVYQHNSESVAMSIQWVAVGIMK